MVVFGVIPAFLDDEDMRNFPFFKFGQDPFQRCEMGYMQEGWFAIHARYRISFDELPPKAKQFALANIVGHLSGIPILW